MTARLSDADWQTRTERLRAAQQRAREAQPTCCPQCGADCEPMYDPDALLWQCEVGHVFAEEGLRW